MYLRIFLFLFLIFQYTYAQENLVLNGKINANLEELKGINITNKTKKFQKVTSNGGYFSLRVSVKDTLYFTHPLLETSLHIVSDTDFKTDLLQLNMKPLASTLLEEINIVKMDPVAMGILQKPAKEYTALERKLYTATDGNEVTLGLLTSFSLDAILNAINGRTKELKKAVYLEKISLIERDILKMFDEEEISSTFNIPQDKIHLFLNYAAYDPELVNAIKTKNKGYTSFMLSKIASNFHQIQD